MTQQTLIPFDFDSIDEENKETLQYCLDQFLFYASHKILEQAIPHVIDGLLPTQRRYLLSLQDRKAFYNKKHAKSAIASANVTMNYAPVGETYNVLVNMSNDYDNQILLVDPEGGWGEQESGPSGAAAMRYTETRLSRFGQESMFHDMPARRFTSIEEPHNIVPQHINYDGTLLEEDYLPSRLPQLFLNGSNGIAVGIAQTFQPMAFLPLINSLISYIKSDGNDIDYTAIRLGYPNKCPIITPQEDFIEAIKTGRGVIKTAASYKLERNTRNKKFTEVIIDTIPHGVYINAIGNAFLDWRRNEGKTIKEEGKIKTYPPCPFDEYQNLSTKTKTDIHFLLKKANYTDSQEQIDTYIKLLYSQTPLIKHQGINMTALDDNFPVVYTLQTYFDRFIKERKRIATHLLYVELEKKCLQLRRLWIQQRIHDKFNLFSNIIVYDDNEEHINQELKTLIHDSGDAHLETITNSVIGFKEPFNGREDAFNREQADLRSHIWARLQMDEPCEEDIAYIWTINARQMAKLSKNSTNDQAIKIGKEIIELALNVLNPDYYKTTIADDLQHFIDNMELYGIRDCQSQFDPSLADFLANIDKVSKKSSPTSSTQGLNAKDAIIQLHNTYKETLHRPDTQDIVVQSSNNLIYLLKNPAQRNININIPFQTSSESMKSCHYVVGYQVPFITSEGRLHFIAKDKLEYNTAYSPLKLAQLLKIKNNTATFYPLTLDTYEPHYLMIVFEDRSLKTIKLGDLKSARSSITIPETTQINYALILPQTHPLKLGIDYRSAPLKLGSPKKLAYLQTLDSLLKTKAFVATLLPGTEPHTYSTLSMGDGAGSSVQKTTFSHNDVKVNKKAFPTSWENNDN